MTTSSIPAGSTAGTAAPPAVAGSSLSGVQLKVTQWRVIKSEWIKARSVRSWQITLLAAAAAVIAFAVIAATVYANRGASAPATAGPSGPSPFRSTDPTGISLTGVTFGQLLVGILGVLVASTEYSSGLVRATFAAVPKRLPVIWAKLIVVGGVLAATMTIASIAAFLAGQGALGDDATTLGADGVLRAVICAGLYLAAVGMIGVALGILLRNTAGSISVLVAGLLIIPTLATAILPADVRADVTPYFPTNAGQAMMSVSRVDGLLSAGSGAAVLGGWVICLVAAAAWATVRRDS